MTNTAADQSFNKGLTPFAEQEIFAGNLYDVVCHYGRGMAVYANLAIPIDNINKVETLNLGEDDNAPVSIGVTQKRVWKGYKSYFSNIVDDQKGSRKNRISELDGMLRKVKSNFVVAQLSVNGKVILSQLSSLLASTSILSYGDLVRSFGVKVDANDLYKHCPLAEVRAMDNTVAKAQGASEKISEWGQKAMALIEKTDAFVIRQLYAACQVHIKGSGGPAIGTEENKVAAGKLLQDVILRTQQNSLVTEKSAAMRSGNAIEELLTMFSSDAMKGQGQVWKGIGEIMYLLKKRKTASPEERVKIDARLKGAKKGRRRQSAPWYPSPSIRRSRHSACSGCAED